MAPATTDATTTDATTTDATTTDATTTAATTEAASCFADGVCAAGETASSCPADCKAEACNYDGLVDDDEQCDDGNHDNTDGCADCVLLLCGDGVVQMEFGEECDGGAWCLWDCKWSAEVVCTEGGVTCDVAAAVAAACLNAKEDWSTLVGCLSNVPEPDGHCSAVRWNELLTRVWLCKDSEPTCWAKFPTWPEWQDCWSCKDCG